MALAGFLVSVREALLYRPARSPSSFFPAGGGFGIRSGHFGVPVFHPDGPRFQPDDSEKTVDEINAEREEALRLWEEAEPIGEVVVDEGDPGREIRDTSAMSAQELSLLRSAAWLGAGGTLIWAFGDLIQKIGM
ncbi:hypothetical protein [Allomesorhizobium alhagi]|nr:hypothetical protein [Mesorhizobium alhagi]